MFLSVVFALEKADIYELVGHVVTQKRKKIILKTDA